MKKIVLITIVLLWTSSLARSQCNETLVQKATEQVGKDAVIVRDFKVKLKEGNKRNASPAGHFSVLMQKDITYRFNILNAEEFESKGVLQLYDKSNMLGSTFDANINQNNGNFQYKCPRTGNYQVMITILDGKAGCAAGLMSMVIDSALHYSATAPENYEVEILYLEMENPLNILVTDLKPNERVDITIDNGRIIRRDTDIYAVVDKEGTAKVTVKMVAADGKVIEEVVKDFKVMPMAEPKVTLEKSIGDYINLIDLTDINRLQIAPWGYKILSFHISTNHSSGSGLRATSEFLTFEQRDLLKGLTVNDKFYINDIQVELTNGKVVTLGPIEYKVR